MKLYSSTDMVMLSRRVLSYEAIQSMFCSVSVSVRNVVGC